MFFGVANLAETNLFGLATDNGTAGFISLPIQD